MESHDEGRSLSDFIEQPDPAIWEEIRSEQHLCSAKICGRNPRCFYQALRRRILSADMVVLNHALLFTPAGRGRRGRGPGERHPVFQ